MYQLETSMDLVIFLSSETWGIEEGTYCVIETSKQQNIDKRIELYGKYYSVICNGDIKVFLKDK